MIKYVFILSSVLLISCGAKERKVALDTVEIGKEESQFSEPLGSMADSILRKTMHVHGGERYDNAHYGFTFREKEYSFDNRKGYRYTVTGTSALGQEIEDKLENGILTRKMDGETMHMPPKEVLKYSAALNSVVYFATLPHKLMDKAVHKKYMGETRIKQATYHIIEITFDKEGGGQDYDDEFHYWINADTYAIDYLAYNYRVNDGGVRFRSAFNRRFVDGILFQDYVNWEAPVGTPLRDLPKLFENGALKELSVISTENVKNLAH